LLALALLYATRFQDRITAIKWLDLHYRCSPRASIQPASALERSACSITQAQAELIMRMTFLLVPFVLMVEFAKRCFHRRLPSR